MSCIANFNLYKKTFLYSRKACVKFSETHSDDYMCIFFVRTFSKAFYKI